MNTPPAVERVLSKLASVKPNGKGWMAVCPAHDDHNPSLSIAAGPDGQCLLHCHAGCSAEQVVAAIGLEMSELFEQADRQVVATHDYRAEDGGLLFQTVRYDPKDFRQRRPDGMGGWIWNLQGVRRVLYRLPALIAASKDMIVYIVEGEKDVDRLTSHGLVATTCPLGAGKWRHVDDKPLHDHHVVILCDADDAGIGHAEEVAGRLFGKAASVRVLDLPGLGEGQDVSDWLDAGNDPEDLDRLATQAPEWQPATEKSCRALKGGERARHDFPDPVPASQLGGSDDVAWLWVGYLARGFITLLTGLWKAGKTTLIVEILRLLETGGELVTAVNAAPVLVIAEESAPLWARRRDASRFGDNVHFYIRPFLTKPRESEWEHFTQHLAQLVRSRGYGLVILDTFGAISPLWDENDAAKMTGALMPLREISDAGAAILLVHHPRKGDGNEGQASRGSGALPGFVDVIVELRRYDTEDRKDTRRVLTTYSRFEESPVDAVIDRGEDGYTHVGSKRDAKQGDRLAVLEEILPSEPPGLSAKEVGERWKGFDVPLPGERTIGKDLKDGLGTDPPRWQRTGMGRSGDPYRYFRPSGGGESHVAHAPPLKCATRHDGTATDELVEVTRSSPRRAKAIDQPLLEITDSTTQRASSVSPIEDELARLREQHGLKSPEEIAAICEKQLRGECEGAGGVA